MHYFQLSKFLQINNLYYKVNFYSKKYMSIFYPNST
nr:MAG TPA: hypothetical protein [Caudoviricetes sp.]